MLRIVGGLLHPLTQPRRMNTEVVCGLGVRHALILDQLDRLKLELSRELPSLHHTPPTP